MRQTRASSTTQVLETRELAHAGTFMGKLRVVDSPLTTWTGVSQRSYRKCRPSGVACIHAMARQSPVTIRSVRCGPTAFDAESSEWGRVAASGFPVVHGPIGRPSRSPFGCSVYGAPVKTADAVWQSCFQCGAITIKQCAPQRTMAFDHGSSSV